MAAYKRKIIVLMVAAVFSLCFVRDASCDTPYDVGNTRYDSVGLFDNDPNFSVGSADGFNTRELFFKMMLSVLFVVGLGVAAIYISKKLLPKVSHFPGKQICIVETVGLGPRKAVHLLQIGNQRLLIGSTGESITKLADITDDSADGLTDLSAQETDNMRM